MISWRTSLLCKWRRLWLCLHTLWMWPAFIPRPLYSSWQKPTRVAAATENGEGPPPFCPLPWIFPRQEWGSTAKPAVLNLLTLFRVVKLRRTLLPLNAREAAWFTLQGFPSGSSGSSKRRPYLAAREIRKTTEGSSGAREGRIPEYKLLPGNKTPSSERKS